jgi:stage II sporulation protein AA (anti-sigma F factor antagonist)
MQNGVRFSDLGEEIIAYLSGEIDHHTAKSIREAIDSLLFRRRPRELALDFSEVRFMDSSGIGLIIGRGEVCREIGASLKITGLTQMQRKLVRLSGVGKIQGISIEEERAGKR